MTLTADLNGEISGKFTIPAGVPAGSKEVRFVGSAGSEVSTTFVGEGSRIIETRQLVTRTSSNTANRADPLAQTFTLPTAKQVAGIMLWFTAKGTTPVDVQLRETSNGVPTQTVIASARLLPSAIATGGAPTQAMFPYPVPLQAGVEYAFVVLCADDVSALAIAELGKLDTTVQQWVTAQPYQVGVLLSSSNAVTWTAHQDRDLAFRILTANFTETSRTIPLGTVAVTGATDLIVRANVESPASVATCRFALTLPDASVHYVASDQLLRLDTAITGDVAVSAILSGSADFSPVLHRDVQLIWGVAGTTGDYVGRSVKAGAGVKIRVRVEADLPGTATIAASFKGDADGAWTGLGAPISSAVMPDGWIELTYESATITKTTIRPKLILTGTSQYRPRARNLRVAVV